MIVFELVVTPTTVSSGTELELELELVPDFFLGTSTIGRVTAEGAEVVEEVVAEVVPEVVASILMTAGALFLLLFFFTYSMPNFVC